MDIQYLRTDLLTRNRLEATIVRVKSPHLFWIQLQNSAKDLQDLEEELKFRMDRKSSYLHLFPNAMRINEDVAIKEGNSWKRGFIKEINQDTLTTKIILADWGRLVQRRMCDVYILEDRFKELTWQALLCGLAYTEPVENTKTWPKLTRDICQVMLQNKKGWINIVNPPRDGAAFVKLEVQTRNTPFNTIYNARDTLIKMGLAKISTQADASVYPSI